MSTCRSMLAAALLAAVAACVAPSLAFQPNQQPTRFDGLTIPSPGAVIARAPVAQVEWPASDGRRQAWDGFSRENGGWRSWLDPRSGLPALALGRGIPWVAGSGNDLRADAAPTLEELERLAHRFTDEHHALVGDWSSQMVLDRAASGPLSDTTWQVTFRQVVEGVPVEAARFDFQVAQGNLVAFGATHWGAVRTGTRPALGAEEAKAALYDYIGADRAAGLVERKPPALVLVPTAAGPDTAYDHLLVWRFVMGAPGEPPTWVAEIDAGSGRVVALYDDTRYGRVAGGVYPISDDQICTSGCEQPGWPMPFADVSIAGGAPVTANDAGMFSCSTPSSSTRTTLAGPYIRVHDNCGAISESSTCGSALDLSVGPGTDCDVPPGHSAGDTHASRSSFYHLNRSMQKGRAWLPSNGWLQSQVTDNVNINATCNAYWDGSVNFYKSGGGCRNTGEIMGVFVHEWGHGLDANDGGGYDNPSEAYADIVAFFETRESCVGRGFFMSGNCSGYGDACLDCTGIRDQDWDKHANHNPATPGGFLQNNCGGGDGPCGREGHCESYLAGEAVWDLAARDLPASGMDPASAWQLTEKLFYKSRTGSGGNAYNCAMPNADGCGTNGWFHKFRVADDDDGDLANGTPHAAAIYAAFARHEIACGAPTDASNQDHSSCPGLATPAIAVSAGPGDSVTVQWTPVANASSYQILRNDIGCDRGQILIDRASAPATSYTDADVPAGLTVFYRVQAVGSNAACESAVSDCTSSAPLPRAGKPTLDRALYPCTATARIELIDGNAPGGSITVSAWSGTETQPETVVLTETMAGSGRYKGTIGLAAGPAVHGDGKVATANGDALTVEYRDADDGSGGHDVAEQVTAPIDCVGPTISAVRDQNTTDTRAQLAWTTNETSDSTVYYGATKPPGTRAIGAGAATEHVVTLSGLTACTVYWYDVRSADPAGNVTTSDNGGGYYHFETYGNFGDGLQPCHAGRVKFLAASYACSDTVDLQLVDLDLNRNPGAAESVVVLLSSSTEATAERVMLTETGPNTSKFTGSIATTGGPPTADGALSVRHGDLVTASYFDADDGTGNPSTSWATVAADCGGPTVSNVTVDAISDARGTIRFTTSEAADGLLEWGTTPALGQSVSSPALTTDHAFAINQFQSCQEVYFRLRSTDGLGNETVVDQGGVAFHFNTWDIPGLYWRDTFENGAPGWTLQGEWEAGPPRGRGGSAGRPDPTSAYNNVRVLGHDLSGRGAFPGDYEPNTNESARTPTLQPTAWRNTKMIYYRRLQSGAGDDARISFIVDGQKITVWRSGSERFDDPDYQYVAQDAAQVDGKNSLVLEFSQLTDGSGAYGGWTIDDVILKDGSKPDYAACGSCGGTPSFAGARQALDNDACGATGVTVSWDKPAAWGTGGAGSYAVYRGTAPGFPADAAHRVASNVKTLSYNDAGAPVGTLYYLVRAETNEACGSGPANGGMVDGNAVYAPVEQTTSRPAPAPVDTLRVGMVARTHVRLTWDAAANATAYDVYRSRTPQAGGFASIGTAAATLYDDVGAAAAGDTYFYLIRSTNPCGQEAP